VSGSSFDSGIGVPTLVVTGGPLDGTAFEVDNSPKARVLGSSPDCDLQILLGNVEPAHAQVQRGPRGLSILDGGSATGTFVNGEKIESETLLQDGDRICLGPPGSKGSAKLIVRLPPDGGVLAGERGLAVPEEPPPDGPETIRLRVGDEPLKLVEPERPSPSPVVDDAPRFTAPEAPPPSFVPPPPAFVPPPPPPPPSVAAPPPPPASSSEARRPAAKPDYLTEQPSIGGERAREQLEVPATPAPARRPVKTARTARLRGGGVRVSPGVLLGLLAVVVAGGGFYAFKQFYKRPPVLASVMPPRSEPGQTVTLSGSDFVADPSHNVVHVGEQTALVTSATDTQLAVTVPAGLAPSGAVDVPVIVETAGGRTKPVTLKVYRAPKVTALEPDVAMPGQELLIKGVNLSGTPLSVIVGGLPAEVKEAQSEQVRVVIPKVPGIEGMKAQVSVTVGSDAARPMDLLLGRLPLLSEVAPKSGQAGDRVSIKGRGFDPAPSSNVVTFSGQPALVLASTPTELTVVAPCSPRGEAQFSAEVRVRSRGTESTSSAGYVLTRVSSSIYMPRFYAAPVTEYPTEDLAFVSTEMGPLLLLGSKGDAASTAERAAKLAAALNALAGDPASLSPTFETRAKPGPSVALVGNPEALLAPTAEDAAAYAKPWEAGAKGVKRTSPRALSVYWAALLQDYFALFVQHQRPLKVIALTPRGKVLSELYANGQRQSSGAGVPVSLVLPLTTGLGKSMRELALAVPDEPARAAVTVEGLWEGSMDDAGVTREIQVRLRAEGTKLAGSLSSTAGSVEVESPLREVAYDKGTLRFKTDIAGSPRIFSGTVQTDTISGTIQRGPADKAPSGTFSLKYLE
jgi:hypothetical protein